MYGVAIKQRGHAPGLGEEEEEEDDAEQPDRFEESFTQKTASVGGDDNVARSKPQFEVRRIPLEVVALIDCVID